MPRPPALVIFNDFINLQIADDGGVGAANLGAFALGGGRLICHDFGYLPRAEASARQKIINNNDVQWLDAVLVTAGVGRRLLSGLAPQTGLMLGLGSLVGAWCLYGLR